MAQATPIRWRTRLPLFNTFTNQEKPRNRTMANGSGKPNYADGYGDLADPETMLYYKLHLAMRYRDQQLENPKCSAGQLYDVITNIGLLRAQLTDLQDFEVTFEAPTESDIDSIKSLTLV